MTKLWVKFKTYNSIKVCTEGCQDVDDFLEACKKKLSSKLGAYDADELSLSTTDGTPLKPDGPIPAQNTAKKPLSISISAQKEMISMPYGKAPLPFICEATELQENQQIWENIPIDTTIQPSPEFVELYKKNCSVFYFDSEASRRTLIDLFLREIVSQFPGFLVICEYHMTLVNETKMRKLNGTCDYTISHRGHRNLPHLVVIEAKVTNHESILQCIGECASIHYRRKVAKPKINNLCVYGIHSTGSVWKFVFIDEDGSLFVSQEYALNAVNYVKEGFDTIYRLVHYVVKQSHINSPRTTPIASLASLNQ